MTADTSDFGEPCTGYLECYNAVDVVCISSMVDAKHFSAQDCEQDLARFARAGSGSRHRFWYSDLSRIQHHPEQVVDMFLFAWNAWHLLLAQVWISGAPYPPQAGRAKAKRLSGGVVLAPLKSSGDIPEAKKDLHICIEVWQDLALDAGNLLSTISQGNRRGLLPDLRHLHEDIWSSDMQLQHSRCQSSFSGS